MALSTRSGRGPDNIYYSSRPVLIAPFDQLARIFGSNWRRLWEL
jgi:hypothetical protein